MNLPIRKKIMIGFGVIIALMVIANAFVLFELNNVSTSAKVTLASDVRAIDFAKHLQTILIDQERNAQKFLISGDKAYFGLFTDGSRQFDDFIDSLLMVQSEKADVELIHLVRQQHAWIISAVNREANQALKDSLAKSEMLTKALSDTLNAIHTTLDHMIRLSQLSIGNAMTIVETTTGHSLGVATVITLATLAGSIVLAVFIARTITHPIDGLIEGTENIARGSFDPIEVTSRDEIASLAEAINEMGYRLKRTEEYKAEMMQQISHELRSPLSTILGAHYLLTSKRAGPVNDQQLRMLEVIRESVDRLTNFSHQFLDIAKIEAGMMEYNFERMNIVPLVTKIVKESEISAVRKNISIDLKPSPSPDVMADAEKLSMAISNLMTNAVKYTGYNGKIVVEVHPSNNGVKISVRDSGIGISAEDLPNVFTKFYKAKNASKSGSRGTGVGLALVKAFAEGHGGNVSVTSTVGVGSTFTIELPSAPENNRAEVQPAKEQEKQIT